MESRTDPPVSEAQRRAMRAAESGHSTLGIPKSVGKEFSKADPGGKLPQHAKDAKLDRALSVMDSVVRRLDALEKFCGPGCRK